MRVGTLLRADPNQWGSVLVAVGINVNPPDPHIPGGLLTRRTGEMAGRGRHWAEILFYDIL
jgi:hypothetical protein